MRKRLLDLGWLLAFLSFPCASAWAQNYAGSYATTDPQGGSVTLALKQDAQKRVSGTLSGNGNVFQVQGQVKNGDLVGTVTGNDVPLYIVARFAGAQLNVILAEPGPDGQPNMQAARQLVMSAATRPEAAKPAAGGAPDDQLSQFLARNAWCGFTYNQRSGTSTRERVVFRGDGLVVQQSGAETYSSGYGGTVAGQHSGGKQGRWRVANGMLQLSDDGFNWAPQQLQITQNSNGSPIIKSGGKEYMVCN
jgi:hypothetical protein